VSKLPSYCIFDYSELLTSWADGSLDGSRPGSRPPTRQISEGGSNTLVTGGTFNTAKSISYANHHHHYEQTGSKELEGMNISNERR